MRLTHPIKIVSIGGGTGLSTLLAGFKPYLSTAQIDLTALVTVTDDGKSSGRLRGEFSTLPRWPMKMNRSPNSFVTAFQVTGKSADIRWAI
jgi:2-phospho-L-lactate transferase CofD